MGVRRRAQAMSRSCSKRKSRFSSLWGLDTTSKKKTKAHPSINQVRENRDPQNCLAEHFFPPSRWSGVDCVRFVAAGLFCLSQQVFADGEEPAKRPLNGIFADAAKEPAVSTDVSLLA